jgi:thioredoxin reductase (NADPH)
VSAGSAGDEEHYQVVIIGAGMAGLSCALECYDIHLDTIVLEMEAEVGGQITEIPFHVRNLAAGGYDDEHPLLPAVERSAAILGDQARRSWLVDRVDLGERWVESAGRRLAADAIVIATGVGIRRLPAADDRAFGGDVTYQLGSDLAQFAARPVVVIGGGDNASLDALALAQTGSKVTLVHRSERVSSRPDIAGQLRDDPRITELAGWELDAVGGDDRLEEVVLVNPATGERRSVKAGGLVVKVGKAPRTELFRGQLEVDRSGAVVVDETLATSRPGVFAAGDVVAGAYWRIATAIGQGSLAARSVLRRLTTRAQVTSDRPPVPPASEVVTSFRRWLEAQAPPDDRRSSVGRKGSDRSGPDGLMQLLLELLRSNLEQWVLEDVTRTSGVDDATVARAKRSIDRLNLGRHRLAERVDAVIDAALVQSATATPSTESPAMAFDRLSVLAVRLDRTRRAAGMAGNGGGDFGSRLPRLSGQLDELSAAIDALLDDVRAGRRRFVPYQHLKLYPPET